MSGTTEQELKKYLSTHLGQGFCPTRCSIHMLSEGHAKVHYGSLNFTFDGKEKSEFIEWTEKNIDEAISIYVQRHLTSKFIQQTDVICVQVVVGGNHGDMAFQFGALVSGFGLTCRQSHHRLRGVDLRAILQKGHRMPY